MPDSPDGSLTPEGRHSYAVVDVETTGPRPDGNDRIGELGIVHVDASGQVTGESCGRC